MEEYELQMPASLHENKVLKKHLNLRQVLCRPLGRRKRRRENNTKMNLRDNRMWSYGRGSSDPELGPLWTL